MPSPPPATGLVQHDHFWSALPWCHRAGLGLTMPSLPSSHAFVARSLLLCARGRGAGRRGQAPALPPALSLAGPQPCLLDISHETSRG